ncbi:unnamed protein product [Darwinula stevensoni]|uniref:Uncharacterized protein n=1 Tax=Darwinula stevensoni TaxID=69355 RepID=A0A7R8XCQ8_9CRUS|nr:unnamed protein product [Darwinula stevensoni]CAG0892446.1 unnamed protein product [Darwinula stevensoni]
MVSFLRNPPDGCSLIARIEVNTLKFFIRPLDGDESSLAVTRRIRQLNVDGLPTGITDLPRRRVKVDAKNGDYIAGLERSFPLKVRSSPAAVDVVESGPTDRLTDRLAQGAKKPSSTEIAAVHVCGCFSSGVLVEMCTIPQNQDICLPNALYGRAVLSSAATMSPETMKFQVLLEDNDTRHTSEQATNWRVENGISYRLVVAIPDLFPIEKVWTFVKFWGADALLGTTSSLEVGRGGI